MKNSDNSRAEQPLKVLCCTLATTLLPQAHFKSRRCIVLALFFGVVLCASNASAQEEELEGAQPSETIGYAGFELSLGQIDEDIFIGTTASIAVELKLGKVACHGWFPQDESNAGKNKENLKAEETCTSPLRLGGQIPLRLRIADRAPKDDELLRAEDWDERAEIMRAVRLVEYGRAGDPLYGRIGELAEVTIGHGTAMNRYYNTIDVDHYQLGFNTQLNSRLGGADLIVGNLLDPSVLGGRAYIRPVALASENSWWKRWVLGATVLLDIHAPREFERVDASVDLSQRFVVTDENNLVPRASKVTGIIGFDSELRLVETKLVDFIPYIDVNAPIDGDPGLHTGALLDIRAHENFRLKTKLELRWMGRRYLPEYFGSLYNIERDAFQGWGGNGKPKLKVLEELNQGTPVGGAGELSFVLWQRAELTLGYQDHEGPRNASTLVKLRVQQVGPASLGLYYTRIGGEGLDDLLEFDNSLLVTEVRYPVVDWLYLLGQYSRLWRLDAESGEYDIVNDWQIGAGSVVTF